MVIPLHTAYLPSQGQLWEKEVHTPQYPTRYTPPFTTHWQKHVTESNHSGGRFGIHLKNTTRIMAPLSVDFLSSIVTSQAQLVRFPAFFSYFHRSEGFSPSVTASASLMASSEFASSTELCLIVACEADEFSAEFSALFLLSPPAEAEAVSVMYVCMHIMFRVHQPTI